MTDYDIRFPPSFYTALRQFNAGDYFECHETLETLWIPEKRPVREVYQGILHVAVGCYHLTARQNWVGAVNQLGKALRRLARWPGVIGGVQLDRLREDAERLRNHLIEIGRGRVREFDTTLLPVITYEIDNE
jgi:uncharacterized protein